MKYADIKVGTDYACDIGQHNIVQATVIEKGTFDRVLHHSRQVFKGAKVRIDRRFFGCCEFWLASRAFLTDWSTHITPTPSPSDAPDPSAAPSESVGDC